MEDFDLQISMNGVENELNANFIGESAKDLWGRKKVNPRDVGISKANTETLAKLSRFEGEPTTDDVPEEDKKSWTDTLNTLTNQFKDLTGYQTNAEAQAKREKEIAEKGTKYKVLGMNPFVAIAVSLAVIIGGSVAITKIKAG
jgi:hypothetical protein